MDALATLFAAISIVASPQMLLLIVAGVAVGIVVGALPGLSVTMAVALLTSVTFGWPVMPALVLMLAVWVGGCYGGAKSAILLNIPGAPPAIATGLDGYPLAQQGKAGHAIAIAVGSSVTGGLFGTAVLASIAPWVAELGLAFGPPEYFLLVLVGLTLLGSLSSRSLLKGLLSGGLGLAIAMIGTDPMFGTPRFTFGSVALAAGVHFVPVLIGIFGISEVLTQVERIGRTSGKLMDIGLTRLRDYLAIFRNCLPLTFRSAAIGTFIGAVPGIGGEVACLVAYDQARRTVKKPSAEFGKGAYEGVLAPETANNAAIGGALIPMLTLGIPGDAVTAVLLGMLYIHGLRPGPLIFAADITPFWVIVLSLVLANFALLFLGYACARWMAKVVSVPMSVLMPIVTGLSVVGSFALQNLIFDIYVAMFFGLLGYLLRKADFPVGPTVLGVILGRMADGELRRTLAMYHGDALTAFLTRPVCLILLAVILVTVLGQTEVVRWGVSRVRSWRRVKEGSRP